MSLDKLIDYWEDKLEQKIILTPSMEFIIKETIRYLKELKGD